MSSSSDRNSTTRMTQATRTQLKPALSRQTCHKATRRPQHGFSQLDLREETEPGVRKELMGTLPDSANRGWCSTLTRAAPVRGSIEEERDSEALWTQLEV